MTNSIPTWVVIVLLIIVILLAVVLYYRNSRSEALSLMKFFGGVEGKINFSGKTGLDRRITRNNTRKGRRSGTGTEVLNSRDKSIESILRSKWTAKYDGTNKSYIEVSGDINGKIIFKDWPYADSWWFEGNNGWSLYCLDVTEEQDERMIQRISGTRNLSDNPPPVPA